MKAPLTVAADRWYHAACTRTANTLTISVQAFDADGTLTGQWSRSATGPRGFGSLTCTKTGTPLSIGGKLTAAGKLVGGSSDQFNGVVDNAVLQVKNG